MKNSPSVQEKKALSSDFDLLSIRENEKKVGERLKELIGNDGVASFGRRCGISEGGLRKYLGGASPSTANLVAMADAANVNIEWLAAGRGPKLRGATSASITMIPPATPSPPSIISVDDIARLTLAIEAVDEGLGPRYAAMPPPKRAKLLAAVYDLLLDMDQKENVVKFIKLAA